MHQLRLGKLRSLQQISTSDGVFAMCAMDHRESFRSMLHEETGELMSYEEMVNYKLELCEALAPYASAVLLDPNYGAAQCIDSGVLPGRIGLLVSIEDSGYKGTREERITALLNHWSVEKIKRLGASAVKLLIYYRPDLISAAARQLAIVEQVAQDCIKYDIAFLVEAKTYPIRGETLSTKQFADKKPSLVIETAQQVTALEVDVLKTEFPADLQHENNEGGLLELCQQLNEASRVPWVILSAGVDYEVFIKEVEIACRAGASGFLGGRAIWQEAMRIEEAYLRVKYLKTIAADRLKRLTDIAIRYATPWYKKLGLKLGKLTGVSEHWYQSY